MFSCTKFGSSSYWWKGIFLINFQYFFKKSCLLLIYVYAWGGGGGEVYTFKNDIPKGTIV